MPGASMSDRSREPGVSWAQRGKGQKQGRQHWCGTLRDGVVNADPKGAGYGGRRSRRPPRQTGTVAKGLGREEPWV